MSLIKRFTVERHNLSQPFTRPFQEPVPLIVEKRVRRIVCPSDDESRALALFNWQGPLGTVNVL